MAKKAELVTQSEVVGLPTNEGIPGVYFANAKRRAEVMTAGKVARQFLTLGEGQAIEGTLTGPGPMMDVKDPDGEPRPCKTWNIDVGNGVTVGILGSHYLDSELPSYVGKKIYIEKGASKSVGTRRVNQYLLVELA